MEEAEEAEEEANTSKTTTAMTTEAEAETVMIRDTSSRRRMRAGEEEEEEDRRGDTRRRTRTTSREEGHQTAGVVTRGPKAAEDAEARISMRRSLRREEIAGAMAGEGVRLHHEATAGDTKARLDRLGLTWGEEVGREARIQVVSVLPFLARKRLLMMSRNSAKTNARSGGPASRWAAGAAICWRGFKRWWPRTRPITEGIPTTRPRRATAGIWKGARK